MKENKKEMKNMRWMKSKQKKRKEMMWRKMQYLLKVLHSQQLPNFLNYNQMEEKT
jgi:hypothetical protein